MNINNYQKYGKDNLFNNIRSSLKWGAKTVIDIQQYAGGTLHAIRKTLIRHPEIFISDKNGFAKNKKWRLI